VGFAAALARGATTDILIPQRAFVVSVISRRRSPAVRCGGDPGLLMGVALVVPVIWMARTRGWGGEPWGTWGEIGRAAWEAKWGLMAPIVILGGIYGGIFTPTEAAVVAVAYGLFYGAAIAKNLNLGVLYAVFRDAAVATSVVMIVVAFAGLFSWTGSTLGVMDRVTKSLLGLTKNPFIILLLLNFMLIIAGMLLDAISIYYCFCRSSCPHEAVQLGPRSLA
jgi:TRAP-type C4-dicarboxylate transport system permease large subunit